MKRLFLTSVLTLAACKPANEVAPRPTPAESPADATTAAVAAPGMPKLTQHPDGTLRLEFIDRWGKPFDATYESAEYLKRAVAVVSRGMTEAQAAHLESQVTSLR